jgi:indolepyruvate ferredoxin oxidoreductase
MTVQSVSLDDKYTLDSGRIYITGVQALIRLPLMQRRRDLAAGRNTACYISGYRGSPLGTYDQNLWRAKRLLKANHIHFEPGVNEDLAATAIWGSQQGVLFPGLKYDGVFGICYGKGPGVDRCGDVFKHANAAGPSPWGGVLALAGDDHGGVSSTLAHQSELEFMSAGIPVLHAANVQEYLDFGILGWALSRYAGVWTGFKCMTETVESSASVDVDPHRVEIAQPDFEMPPGGLTIRWPDHWLEQEKRLYRYKLPAVLAFARANRFDRLALGEAKARLGIVTTGKSYLDLRQALEDLGITEPRARELGIAAYKVGMVWPLEPDGIRRFAENVEELLVVEEKRPVIEAQLKDILYNLPADRRPRILGKQDESGAPLLQTDGELSPSMVARALAQRIARFAGGSWLEERVAWIESKERLRSRETSDLVRTPYFCSGCPHNTSTKVPDGSRALAGIGCHFMAQMMNRSTATFTQMGGEGVPWLGQAPFCEEKHVFANIGDGTYEHSGLLAIRAAAASGVNITYKILFNDAVAMTGGQPHDGPLNPALITRQVHAEGAKKIAVVTDEPDKYAVGTEFAPGTTIHHRDELDAVQRAFREVEGLSVIVYDQTCAAEKRRRRKRGAFPDPDKRVFINDLVCEGCGDCSTASNCVSVEPLETEFGRKRQINQSACNKDFSCVKGFCPSFVTMHGGKPRRTRAQPQRAGHDPFAELPLPEMPPLDQPYGILVTGIGGTGVITVGALLGMAAHVDGKGVSVLDNTGLAQKNGAVMSHVRIAAKPEQIHTVRLPVGGADLILGCDMVVAAGGEAMARIDSGRTRAVINSHMAPTAAFTLNPDVDFNTRRQIDLIRRAAGDNLTDFVDATGLGTALLGDAIAANLFLLGFAFQRGLIPLSLEAIHAAIELNGVAIETNKRTFAWGRLAAHDIKAVEGAAKPQMAEEAPRAAETLEDLVARRTEFLTGYQDAAYAERYRALVRKVEAVERERAKGMTGLAEAVARYYFKLLAYKDEYEVARLYTDGSFAKKLAKQFEGNFTLKFHLAPPMMAPRDPATGRLIKREFGPWMLPMFRILANFKGLRGTAFDIFGRTAERRMERQLISDYERTIDQTIGVLTPQNHALAVQIAQIPERIRGFGHVKERHIAEAKAREAELLAAFRAPAADRAAAE